MTVTRDVNLGTLVPIGLWLIGSSIAAIWWAAHQTADVEEIRQWQIRQDSRIDELETSTSEIIRQNARIQALQEVLRNEINRLGETLLEEIRSNRNGRNGNGNYPQ